MTPKIARFLAAHQPATPCVVLDIDRVESMGVHCIVGNFLSEGDVLRHAGDHLAAALLELGRMAAVKN